MAFKPEVPVAPTQRGAVSIVFYIPDPQKTTEDQYGILEVQIYYSDDTMKVKKYDLLKRLGDDAAGQTHLANLGALKTYLLARIESEVLA